MQFSIITVTLNSAKTVQDTLESVAIQKGVSVQHIIKDGGSTDRTLEICQDSRGKPKIVKQQDDGIYDAMNQGFMHCEGEVVGFLNSDDFFSYDLVLNDVYEALQKHQVDIVYGDIFIINERGQVTRDWKSGHLRDGRLDGRQLPHPAFFVRKSTLLRLDKPFDEDYKISADFKQQLQLINKLGASTFYLEKTLVTMRAGGASTANFSAVLNGWRECARAYKETTGEPGLGFVAKKVLRKITQLLPSSDIT